MARRAPALQSSGGMLPRPCQRRAELHHSTQQRRLELARAAGIQGLATARAQAQGGRAPGREGRAAHPWGPSATGPADVDQLNRAFLSACVPVRAGPGRQRQGHRPHPHHRGLRQGGRAPQEPQAADRRPDDQPREGEQPQCRQPLRQDRRDLPRQGDGWPLYPQPRLHRPAGDQPARGSQGPAGSGGRLRSPDRELRLLRPGADRPGERRARHRPHLRRDLRLLNQPAPGRQPGATNPIGETDA